MATGVTPKPMLNRKISEGQLECPICFNRFREPKLLTCSHTFCQPCLQNIRQHQTTSKTRLICPLCRHETILEGTDIAGLPSNLTLSALVEEVIMLEKIKVGHGSEIKCQSCDEKNPAIAKCMDCDHFICHDCKRAHEHMTVTKSHKIYTLAQLRSGEISIESKLRSGELSHESKPRSGEISHDSKPRSGEISYERKPRVHIPKCPKHPNEILPLYCNTCEEMICLTCTITDHEKPKHFIIRVPEASDKCKRQVAGLVARVEQIKTKLTIGVNKVDLSKEKLDSMFADTKRKISQKADQQFAKIREEERKLIQEAEKIYKDRVKRFESAHAFNTKEKLQVENKLDEVNQLMTQASCYEILNLQKKLLHNLSELTAKQPERVPDRLSFMDFDDKGEGLLGRLTVDQPQAWAKKSQSPVEFSLKTWELKTEIQDFGLPNPRHLTHDREDVASFSNDQIVVAHRNTVIAFSLPKNKGTSPSPNILPINGLTKLKCVAVNRDDQLIILDKDTVKIFNKKHQLLHQFTPRKGSKDEPQCLAVDDKNLIAVGYKDEISLHNPDGSLVRTLPAPMTNNFLTTCKQRFIYTNYGSKRLVSLDYSGATVFSVNLEMKEYGYAWGPTGVCCDSDGSIYVAAYEWPSGDILHYSPDGKFIGCAIRRCGPARGITLTPAGDLVEIAWNAVKVYRHVTSK